MIGYVIDLLLLIGAMALAVLAFKVGKSARNKTPQTPADGVLHAQLREDIANDAQTQQDAIQDALNGKDPATALSDLGNQRRS